MSHTTLSEIIERASTDEQFRISLINDLEQMIRENKWELSDREISALKNMKNDPGESTGRGLDERVSKALYGTDTHSVMW